jgi:hypothetical protein
MFVCLIFFSFFELVSLLIFRLFPLRSLPFVPHSRVEKEAEKRTKEIETEIEVLRSKAATDSHYYDVTKTAEACDLD